MDVDNSQVQIVYESVQKSNADRDEVEVIQHRKLFRQRLDKGLTVVVCICPGIKHTMMIWRDNASALDQLSTSIVSMSIEYKTMVQYPYGILKLEYIFLIQEHYQRPLCQVL